MYRSILLPLDGSRFGEQAIPVALTLARRCRAQLKVVHVHQPTPAGEWELVTPFRYEGLDHAEREWDREDLRHEQEYLAAHAAGADFKVIEGPVVQSLEQEVKESDPDLIVMSTHGRTGLGVAFADNVADHMIRDLHKPVLLVRVRENEAPREFHTQHVLIPLDGSPLATSVLKHALSIAEPAETRITLLRIVSPPYVSAEVTLAAESDDVLRDRVNSAHEYLESIATELRAEGYNVSVDVVISSHAADAISNYAFNHAAGVICMATHGRGGLKRMLLGSVTTDVLKTADVPVLLYRP